MASTERLHAFMNAAYAHNRVAGNRHIVIDDEYVEAGCLDLCGQQPNLASTGRALLETLRSMS